MKTPGPLRPLVVVVVIFLLCVVLLYTQLFVADFDLNPAHACPPPIDFFGWRIGCVALKKVPAPDSKLSDSGGSGVKMTSDGRTVASDRNCVLQVWDVSKQSIIFFKPLNDIMSCNDSNQLVVAKALSNNGSAIAIAVGTFGFREVSIHIWRMTDGTLVRIIRTGTSRIGSMTFSDDGTRLAFVGTSVTTDFAFVGYSVNVLRVSDGSSLFSLNAAGDDFHNTGVAFSPDGSTLAISRPSGIQLWRLEDSSPVWKNTEPPSPLHTIAFSRDGSYLVGQSDQGLIRIWDSLTGRLIRSILPKEEYVHRYSHSFAVSYDSSLIVTCLSRGNPFNYALPGRVHVYRITDGALVQKFYGDSFCEKVGISEDGKFVFVALLGGNEVSVWAMR